MKHLLFLFAITFLGFTACRTAITDWDRFELNGKVQSFSETRYEAILKDDGSWEQGDQQEFSEASEFIFNETGVYIKSHWYLDGELQYITTPEYVGGRMVGSLNENDEGEKTGESKVIEEANGYRIIESYGPEGELEFRSLQRHRGLLMLSNKSTHFRPDGEVQFEMEATYSHNRDGTLKSVTQTIDGERNLSYEMSYLEYDDRGNWICRIAFDNSGNPDNYGIGIMSVREIVYY